MKEILPSSTGEIEALEAQIRRGCLEEVGRRHVCIQRRGDPPRTDSREWGSAGSTSNGIRSRVSSFRTIDLRSREGNRACRLLDVARGGARPERGRAGRGRYWGVVPRLHESVHRLVARMPASGAATRGRRRWPTATRALQTMARRQRATAGTRPHARSCCSGRRGHEPQASTDYGMLIKQLFLMRFDGEHWVPFGGIIGD